MTTPDKRDPEALARFVERFTLVLTDAGIPRMPARVFVGLLTADSGQRTAAELAAVLQVSPAAISGAVQYLVQVGLAVRGREPGRRSDHYRLESDLWYEAITHRDAMLGRWEDELAQGVAVLGPDSGAGRRLDETRLFFAFMRAELPALMARWRALRAERLADPPA